MLSPCSYLRKPPPGPGEEDTGPLPKTGAGGLLYLGPPPGPPFASHYIAYDCSSSYLAPCPGYKTPFPPPYNFMFGGKDRAEGARRVATRSAPRPGRLWCPGRSNREKEAG